MEKRMSKRVHVGWSLGMIWVRETLAFQLGESYIPELTNVMYLTCNTRNVIFSQLTSYFVA